MRAAALLRHGCALLAAVLLSSAALSGCAGDGSDAMKIALAYRDGFESLYTQGQEYAGQGLQIQADYAYGWAAASVSAMRYCVDCLLYLKGEGDDLEGVVGGRRGDWDEIAALGYASPYPYYFEGLVYNAQGKNDDARRCYESALINPAFSAEHDEALSLILTFTVKELKSLRQQLAELEDKVYAAYRPEATKYPRNNLNWSDAYLRSEARAALSADETNLRAALRHYEAALAVNPFEGDNFFGCALMHLYLGESDKLYFYVNEGLYADPEHEGLGRLAQALSEEVGHE